MKKLFYTRTNAYDMLVSVDTENNCRYLVETNDFPRHCSDTEEFMKNVETFMDDVCKYGDDSDWEDDCTYDEIFDGIEILAERKDYC